MNADGRNRGKGRREDERLLRGMGSFVADLRPEGLCHAVFVRSPHAHARVIRIDTAAARAMPGVLAVLTAADLGAQAAPRLTSANSMTRPDGSPAPSTPRPLLCDAIVRHVGEPVAMVVATDLFAAIEAAEHVDADYRPLPAVTTTAAARMPGAQAIWEPAKDNIAFRWSHGDHAAVERALTQAAHVTRLRYGVSRVAASPMEPRVILARRSGDGGMLVEASTQNPFQLREGLARLFGRAPDRIRVVARDVGGAFGMKAGVTREDALVFWAAEKLGRPIRWMSDRSEAFLSDDQARDVQMEAALALDANGIFRALQVRYDLNLGAYLSDRSFGPITNAGGMAGVYRTPLISVEVWGVLTNTLPTAPYRGAGRPEATYVIERLIDVAAAELGLDRIDLRRRNLIPASAMPYKTGLLFEYDCGDFRANMDAAAIGADLAGFAGRKAASEARGLLRGLGLSNPIEVAGGPYGRAAPDRAKLVIASDGAVNLYTGAMSVGQGLETAWADIVARRLGIAIDRFVYHQGDTAELAAGRGSGGSSGLCVSGSAVALAVEAAIETGKQLAADRLEAAVADIEYAAGAFTVAGTDRTVTLSEIARAAAAKGEPGSPEPGLTGAASFLPPTVTFPNGCHVCEVEIDPETGVVTVERYHVVEDIGFVLNEVLVHGQIHGGVAQAIGQALLERVQYDADSAQLLTGSFMDYAMPRAADIPSIGIQTREVPTKVNALGAKGVGEAGTVGALSASMNAVCHALAPLGVRHFDMPATPERVWSAIRAARKAAPRA
jgi:aerobic carbon-monoxide dehydrogenase large subunit